MNEENRNSSGFSFLVGFICFAAGIGTGYLSARHLFNKKLNEKVDEAIADFKIAYTKKRESLEETYNKSGLNKSITINNNFIKNELEVEGSEEQTSFRAIKPTSYNLDPLNDDRTITIDDKETESDVIYEDEEDDEEEPYPLDSEGLTEEETNNIDEAENPLTDQEAMAKIPYVISSSEYDSDTNYQKAELSYYEGNDVLVDDEQMRVGHINDVIGDDALNHFGDSSGDPDLVYIRNEALHTDFEVILEHGSFIPKESVKSEKKIQPKKFTQHRERYDIK